MVCVVMGCDEWLYVVVVGEERKGKWSRNGLAHARLRVNCLQARTMPACSELQLQLLQQAQVIAALSGSVGDWGTGEGRRGEGRGYGICYL